MLRLLYAMAARGRLHLSLSVQRFPEQSLSVLLLFLLLAVLYTVSLTRYKPVFSGFACPFTARGGP